MIARTVSLVVFIVTVHSSNTEASKMKLCTLNIVAEVWGRDQHTSFVRLVLR